MLNSSKIEYKYFTRSFTVDDDLIGILFGLFGELIGLIGELIGLIGMWFKMNLFFYSWLRPYWRARWRCELSTAIAFILSKCNLQIANCKLHPCKMFHALQPFFIFQICSAFSTGWVKMFRYFLQLMPLAINLNRKFFSRFSQFQRWHHSYQSNLYCLNFFLQVIFHKPCWENCITDLEKSNQQY